MSKRDAAAKKLADLGCDPITAIARIAAAAESAQKLELAGKMYAELAQYVAPKLKSVEHSMDPDDPLALLTAEERRQRIVELQERLGIAPRKAAAQLN